MNRTIADIVDDAADLIERNGWFNPTIPAYEGGNQDEDRHCVMTAIGQVTQKYGHAWQVALDAMGTYVGIDNREAWELPQWNDGHDEPQPVLDAMRGCAKELRKMDDLGEVE